MKKLAHWLAKPKIQSAFNGWMTILWLIMLPVTLIFPIFRSSILWVAFISAWALFATHLGAWIAALVNVKAERIDDRTEEALHLARIEATEQKIIESLAQGHDKILAKIDFLHEDIKSLD